VLFFIIIILLTPGILKRKSFVKDFYFTFFLHNVNIFQVCLSKKKVSNFYDDGKTVNLL